MKFASFSCVVGHVLFVPGNQTAIYIRQVYAAAIHLCSRWSPIGYIVQYSWLPPKNTKTTIWVFLNGSKTALKSDSWYKYMISWDSLELHIGCLRTYIHLFLSSRFCFVDRFTPGWDHESAPHRIKRIEHCITRVTVLVSSSLARIHYLQITFANWYERTTFR